MKTNSARNAGYGTWLLLLASGLAGSALACSNTTDNCEETRTCATPEGQGGAGEARDGGGGNDEASSDAAGGAKTNEAAGGATVAGAGGESALEPPGGSSAGAAAQGPVGAAGEAGASSVAPAPECERDQDCDDQLACNGYERCDAGKCIAGPAPICANADPQHCSVACVAVGSGFQSAATPLDADGDGHGTPLCGQNPGDDCDDRKKTTFPGAPELCDLVDNDCDKKVDLDDGLTFAGESRQVGDSDPSTFEAYPSLVWSQAANAYGMVWISGTDILFATYAANGKLKSGPSAVASDRYVGLLAIAPGPGGFGVAWSSESNSVGFRTVNVKGQLGKQVWLGQREGEGGLSLAWSEEAKLWAIAADHGLGSVAANGTPTDFTHKFNNSLNIMESSLISAAGGFLVGLSATMGVVAAPDARLYYFAPSLEGPGELVDWENLAGNVLVRLAARPDGGFAVASSGYEGAGSARLDNFDAKRALTCSVPKLRGMSGWLTGLTTTANGYTAAFEAFEKNGVSFVDVSNDCKPGKVVKTKLSGAGNVSIAASPSSFAACWRDADDTWRYSIFGSNYCN